MSFVGGKVSILKKLITFFCHIIVNQHLKYQIWGLSDVRTTPTRYEKPISSYEKT